MFKAEKEKKKVSWNWAAFIFGPYWFFYRKMMTVGLVIMLILLATAGLCTNSKTIAAENTFFEKYSAVYNGNGSQEEAVAAGEAVTKMPEYIILSCVTLAAHIYAGLFGNYHYRKKVEKEVAELKSSADNPEQYRIGLFRKGGVSGIMFALSYVGFQSALQLINMFIQKVILKM